MKRRLSVLVVLAVAGTMLLPAGVAAGGMCIPDPARKMTTSSRPFVTIDECAFGQTVTYVDPGDAVRWVNKDVYPHSVTGAALSWGTKDLFMQGDSVSYTFAEEGVYPYYCDLHPSMVGAVVVGDGRTAATGVAVEKVDDTKPASSNTTVPADTSDGVSPAVLALALAAGLAAIVAGARFALTRRAGAPSAS